MIFFREVEYDLKCCTSSLRVFAQSIEDFLLRFHQNLLFGDTNPTLAAALAARKTNCSILVEAGSRCFDKTLIEEIKRVIMDSISDYLFTPAEIGRVFLKFESIPKDRILVMGNLIVDVCKKYSYDYDSARFNDLPTKYILLTMHKQENIAM